MNGINFPMDGPCMSGTWYNPHTKDSFTVRDTFFENNQLMVQTTDGRMMDYNMIQNYVQCNPKDIPVNETKQTYNELPAEVAELLETPTPQDPNMLEEDMLMISGQSRQPIVSLGNLNTPSPNAVKLEQQGGQSEDQRLIQRVLSRQQQPSISCNINWAKFPQKQMDVLMDMMGVDLDDVCNFYISKIDLNDIRESIKRDIKTYIESAMGYNGIDEQYAPVQIQEPITIIGYTPTKDYEETSTSTESITDVSGSMTVTNDRSRLELQEFEMERPEKPKKKTTKPTTKKTTRKK